MSSRSIAIIGAGPVGLEAALAGTRGGFDVHVFERGEVGGNVRQWGHVRMFSPFGMNSSPAGRARVAQHFGCSLPGIEELLTGAEFARSYLQPLSRLPELNGRIHERMPVIAIGRMHFMKGDAIGKPSRAGDRFQLLLQDEQGRERVHAADLILDCSGTFPNHNWLGAGGIPCPGERAAACRIEYGLPDLLGEKRADYIGRHTLVIGGGYSAATAVVSLAELARDDPRTRITWVVRRPTEQPIPRISNDPLTERDRLAAAANEVAATTVGPLRFLPGSVVREIREASDSLFVTVDPAAPHGDNAASVEMTPRCEPIVADRIIANVGYRPDRGLYEELQVHECYATQGPIRLAAALLGESSGDCLSQPPTGPQTLCHPEPGFFILGAKSYGRNPNFLVRAGLQQIENVYALLG